MELTLESAFSTGGLVGHFSYLLLVISMMMRSIGLLRMFVIASAFVAISYDWFWLKDPIGVFWESVLVLVNIIQLLILYWGNLTAKFNEDEAEFIRGRLPGLSKAKSRQLLDTGQWLMAVDGDVLTRQGDAVRFLYYIARGKIDVLVANTKVSECGPGDFIGEITVMSNESATATTIVRGGAQIWQISEPGLSKLLRRHPEIQKELDASFSRNFKDKLIQSNFLISNGMVP